MNLDEYFFPSTVGRVTHILHFDRSCTTYIITITGVLGFVVSKSKVCMNGASNSSILSVLLFSVKLIWISSTAALGFLWNQTIGKPSTSLQDIRYS